MGSGSTPRSVTFLRWRVISPVAACLVFAAVVFTYEQHRRAPHEELEPAPVPAAPVLAPSSPAPPSEAPASSAAPSASAANSPVAPTSAAAHTAATVPSKLRSTTSAPRRAVTATLGAGAPFTPPLPRTGAPHPDEDADRAAPTRRLELGDDALPSVPRGGGTSGAFNPALPRNDASGSNPALPHSSWNSGSSWNPALPNNGSSSSFELP